MADGDANEPWRVDGKFFRCGARRVPMDAVTYGPFPGGWPDDFGPDFRRIAGAGFTALRLFEMPDRRLLDAARAAGLRVFGGLQWGQHADFFHRPGLFSAARVNLAESLRAAAAHPALAGVYVGNEVPADLVRWMGPLRVRQAIEQLIALGRKVAPHLLFAYANYPSTEYLEPENADFSAFNVYLEDDGAYRGYLRRLQHIAGDRPLVISEFGMDSRRNGLERQAEVLEWAVEISREQECAGLTLYAWSDRWWNHESEILDWDFGLTDREGLEKPALARVARQLRRRTTAPVISDGLEFSVVICTRNGRERIGRCLDAVARLEGGGFEVIVVDDGSDDGTAQEVAEHHPLVRLLPLEPCGLSSARNAGAAAARGSVLAFTDDDCEPDREWLVRLRRVFADGRFDAAGGPNLPPPSRFWREAVVCAAPGAPSHVMLDDEEAEHLPGCNLAVTRAAFDEIGGFDPRFHTAGDDVDFCWRLREAGFHLGFAPGAFVWHWRRPDLRAFLRQQLGYGRAERLLIAKHPRKFSKHGGAVWEGFVYGGGPVRVMTDSILYHGPMGSAGYQSVTNRMLPLRGLDDRFNSWYARLALRAVESLVPGVRGWARNRCLGWRNDATRGKAADRRPDRREIHEHDIMAPENPSREQLLQALLDDGWLACGATDLWDAEKQGTRVLLATEHAADGSRHARIRIEGDPSLVPFHI